MQSSQGTDGAQQLEPENKSDVTDDTRRRRARLEASGLATQVYDAAWYASGDEAYQGYASGEEAYLGYASGAYQGYASGDEFVDEWQHGFDTAWYESFSGFATEWVVDEEARAIVASLTPADWLFAADWWRVAAIDKINDELQWLRQKQTSEEDLASLERSRSALESKKTSPRSTRSALAWIMEAHTTGVLDDGDARWLKQAIRDVIILLCAATSDAADPYAYHTALIDAVYPLVDVDDDLWSQLKQSYKRQVDLFKSHNQMVSEKRGANRRDARRNRSPFTADRKAEVQADPDVKEAALLLQKRKATLLKHIAKDSTRSTRSRRNRVQVLLQEFAKARDAHKAAMEHAANGLKPKHVTSRGLRRGWYRDVDVELDEDAGATQRVILEDDILAYIEFRS